MLKFQLSLTRSLHNIRQVLIDRLIWWVFCPMQSNVSDIFLIKWKFCDECNALVWIETFVFICICTRVSRDVCIYMMSYTLMHSSIRIRHPGHFFHRLAQVLHTYDDKALTQRPLPRPYIRHTFFHNHWIVSAGVGGGFWLDAAGQDDADR